MQAEFQKPDIETTIARQLLAGCFVLVGFITVTLLLSLTLTGGQEEQEAAEKTMQLAVLSQRIGYLANMNHPTLAESTELKQAIAQFEKQHQLFLEGIADSEKSDTLYKLYFSSDHLALKGQQFIESAHQRTQQLIEIDSNSVRNIDAGNMLILLTRAAGIWRNKQIKKARAKDLTIQLLWLASLPVLFMVYGWMYRPLILLIHRNRKHWQSEKWQLQEQIKKQNAQLTAQLDLQDRWISTSQPLVNNIKDLAGLGIHEQDDHQIRAQLVDIEDHSKILAAMNSMLSDYKKLESGQWRLAPEHCSLQDMLQKQVERIRKHVLEKKLSLNLNIRPDVPELISIDAKTVETIVSNLLRNAVQHTKVGEIKIDVQLLDKHKLQICVQDSGTGIPERIVQHLEMHPDQPVAKNSEDQGLGIGLLICRKAAELLGGSLHLKSQNVNDSASGTQAILKLPFTHTPKRQTRYHERFPVVLEGKRILFCQSGKAAYESLMAHFDGIMGLSLDQCEKLDQVVPKLLQQEELKHPYDLILISAPSAEALSDLKKLLENAQQHQGLCHDYCQIYVHAGAATVNEQAESLPQLSSQWDEQVFMEKLSLYLKTHMEQVAKAATLSEQSRILIVEDNDINLMVLENMVEATGVQYESAKDGKIAVDLCRQQTYDLVLMDLQMPNMDGFEATHAIYRELGLHQLPIFAVTANHDFEDRLECYKQGMKGCMAKPIKNTELVYTLSRYL